jgi:2-phosphosulfolactate phosphatase
MSRPIQVHLLPALVSPEELSGGLVVVIDALRATTTIVYALEAGAERIIPCGEIDEAKRLAGELPGGTALLGGERLGLRIEGFDLGNSPAEYTPEVVGGRTIVFTTTNGTRAMLRAREARRVVLAAFANVNAVIGWLAAESGPIHILCAGTDGRITLEDVLCAGTIVRGLIVADPAHDETCDDAGLLALCLSESQGGDYDSVRQILRGSLGGRNLIEHGLDADIETAARWDASALVPELSREPWQIRPAPDARPERKRFVEPAE